MTGIREATEIKIYVFLAIIEFIFCLVRQTYVPNYVTDRKR